MPIVEMPNGDRVSFPDDMPKEQIRSMIEKKFPEVSAGKVSGSLGAASGYLGAPDNAPSARDRAVSEADKIETAMPTGTMSDFTHSIDPLLGWGDEAYSAIIGAPARMLREGVKGNVIGYGEAYSREQALQNELQNRRETRSPIASTAGKIVGGGTTGGTLAKGGLTMLGRELPVIGKTGAAMIEGGLYGGAQSAGDAPEGKKTGAAIRGAATGAVTAGVISKAGDKISSYLTQRATKAATPNVEQLRQTETALFEQARNSGVFVKPKATDNLITDMVKAGGRINPNLRQKTAGMIDDLIAQKGKALDVQAVHEIRRQIGRAMMSAESDDAMALGKMLDVLDNFIDNASPASVSGGRAGLDNLRKAIGISAQRFKVERINKLLDFADVKTGQYTQSGMMNALRSEASTLYRQIKNGNVKGFTPQEIEIIRNLAATKNSSAAVKWLSKLAPRGVVSMGMGSGMFGAAGFALGGPAGGAIGASIPPAAGYIAAHSADTAAAQAATGLRDMIARGGQAIPQVANPLLPLVRPAAIGAGQYMTRQGR